LNPRVAPYRVIAQAANTRSPVEFCYGLLMMFVCKKYAFTMLLPWLYHAFAIPLVCLVVGPVTIQDWIVHSRIGIGIEIGLGFA
jgi:hypothetical protein